METIDIIKICIAIVVLIVILYFSLKYYKQAYICIKEQFTNKIKSIVNKLIYYNEKFICPIVHNVMVGIIIIGFILLVILLIYLSYKL